MNLNQVNLMGRLTANPELRMIGDNKCVCNFTIACERYDREKVDFIHCVAWNRNAEFLCKWFSKGNMVILSGSLRTRTYDVDGEKRYATEISVRNIFFSGKYVIKDQEEKSNIQPEEPASESVWNDDLDLSEFEEILSDEEVPF